MGKMLDMLDEKRIFNIEKISNSHVQIFESCDGYFGCKLSKAQLGEIILELTEIYKQLEFNNAKLFNDTDME